MLKTLRKHAKYFYVLFFIVILTFIFWGVGPLDKPTDATIAEIGKEKISVQEYWRTYERARDFYREIYGGQFDQEMENKLKETVLNGLIEERVLLIAARESGIKVTDQELQDAIIRDERFVRDGAFRKDVYLKTLQLNRLTPEIFENSVRQQLTLQKMRLLIWSAVDVTPYDMGNTSLDEKRMKEIGQIILSQKREMALKSYIEGMKLKLNVKVNKELIS
jgi:peptidyl-prolyl cis-trans isomerase D